MTMFIVYTIVLLVVQVCLFLSLPKILQKIITFSILGGTIVNFIFSYYILYFVGQGNTIGCANLCASILFSAVLVYKRKELYGKVNTSNQYNIE